MTSLPSKQISDDVSLLVVLIDTNPFFWCTSSSSLHFHQFVSHVLVFLDLIVRLSQLNQIVVIATGHNTCDYIYDSSLDTDQVSGEGDLPALYTIVLQRLEEFVSKDEKSGAKQEGSPEKRLSSLLSGSLSRALCYIQRVFRSGPLHPQPRVAYTMLSKCFPFGRGTDRQVQILCLQGSPDGSEQYVSIMNAIFSAQRSMVPIDCCYVGSHNSAFLQQASYITGGVYVKPQHLDGLYQYLATVFAVDLHSRSFLQLPRPAGVDFRASCFCHKTTIDMGYVCSVCLSIFCKHHDKCSTCGSVFGKAQSDATSDRKRKAPET